MKVGPRTLLCPSIPYQPHQTAQHPLNDERIAVAAYYRAKKRGFESGHELDDWLAAEVELAVTAEYQRYHH